MLVAVFGVLKTESTSFFFFFTFGRNLRYKYNNKIYFTNIHNTLSHITDINKYTTRYSGIIHQCKHKLFL